MQPSHLSPSRAGHPPSIPAPIESGRRLIASAHPRFAKLASRVVVDRLVASLHVRSDAFDDGQPLPSFSTVEGAAFPPPIAWSEVPPETDSVAVLCEDADTLFPQPFVHWLVFGIPAAIQTLTGDSAPVWSRGTNSDLSLGFLGAHPLGGDGVHHYHFQVFALDCVPDLEDGATRRVILGAMRGHVIAFGDLVGTSRQL